MKVLRFSSLLYLIFIIGGEALVAQLSNSDGQLSATGIDTVDNSQTNKKLAGHKLTNEKLPAEKLSAKPQQENKQHQKRKDGLLVGMFQQGEASYYADKFHGRKTASGEHFDMYAMTAAHKTLPFGTVLSVRNLNNGKTVQVRVNDRGPFIEGRIIDVSKRAAEHLGMMGSGVIPTEIVIHSLPNERKLITKNKTKVLGKPLNKKLQADKNVTSSQATPIVRKQVLDQRRFAIQIASYAKLKYAQQQKSRLENAGIPIHFEKHGPYHRLIIVHLNKQQVKYYRAELSRLGINNILVRQE